jgi:hypothetical protein
VQEVRQEENKKRGKNSINSNNNSKQNKTIKQQNPRTARRKTTKTSAYEPQLMKFTTSGSGRRTRIGLYNTVSQPATGTQEGEEAESTNKSGTRQQRISHSAFRRPCPFVPHVCYWASVHRENVENFRLAVRFHWKLEMSKLVGVR